MAHQPMAAVVVNRENGSLLKDLQNSSVVVVICCRHLSSEFFPVYSKAKTRRRQKPISALNSTRIGEGAKAKQF
jgi:hypothetical protein